MNNYPNPPPPPNSAPVPYNPFNPYSGYDPGADYVPWLPGRQGPRFLPLAIIVGAVLLCSCCAFFVGIVVGIELPGFLEPSPSQPQNPPADQQPPTEEPTPGSFQWQVVYKNI